MVGPAVVGTGTVGMTAATMPATMMMSALLPGLGLGLLKGLFLAELLTANKKARKGYGGYGHHYQQYPYRQRRLL